MEEEERKKELKKREAEERARLREKLRAKHAQQEEAKHLCTAFYKSGPKMVLQCTTLCLPDADGVFLCGCHQNKENALPDLVAPLEVETPTSSQFQKASPVALELERQKKKSWGNTLPTLCLHVLDLFVIVCIVAFCIHTLN